MRILFKPIISLALLSSLLTSLAGCGTLLYPERRGQTGGQLDPGIVILDGIGLLFFVIPGLFAFAVDFTTGAIYLPKGKRASLDLSTAKVLPFDPKTTDRLQLQEVLREAGVHLDPEDPRFKVYTFADGERAKAFLAHMRREG